MIWYVYIIGAILYFAVAFFGATKAILKAQYERCMGFGKTIGVSIVMYGIAAFLAALWPITGPILAISKLRKGNAHA